MKSLSSMNKKNLVNILITVSVVVAIILMITMNQLMGTINQQYILEEDVYGTPFNIGFRWSAILGMFGVIIYQCALYAMVSCNRKWKWFVCLTGIWLYSVIVFHPIEANSRIFIMISLRDRGYVIADGIVIWNSLRMLACLVLGILSLFFFWKWTPFSSNEDLGRKSFSKGVLTIILGLLGIIILFLRSFTNPWYIELCGITSAVTWFLLVLLEKKWNQWK